MYSVLAAVWHRTSRWQRCSSRWKGSASRTRRPRPRPRPRMRRRARRPGRRGRDRQRQRPCLSCFNGATGAGRPSRWKGPGRRRWEAPAAPVRFLLCACNALDFGLDFPRTIVLLCVCVYVCMCVYVCVCVSELILFAPESPLLCAFIVVLFFLSLSSTPFKTAIRSTPKAKFLHESRPVFHRPPHRKK